MQLRINWRESRAGTDATQSIVLVDLGEAQVVGEEMKEDRVGYVAPRGETPLSREYSVRDQVIFTTSGEPLAALGTPLQRARYFYDVPLPWPMGVSSKESYTLLLRVLNSDGFPVSEEQEVRMRLPKDWGSRVPGFCLKNRQLVITADLETRVPLWDLK